MAYREWLGRIYSLKPAEKGDVGGSLAAFELPPPVPKIDPRDEAMPDPPPAPSRDCVRGPAPLPGGPKAAWSDVMDPKGS